jgi:hypothetical protein
MTGIKTEDDLTKAMVLRLAMHRIYGTTLGLSVDSIDGRSKKRLAREYGPKTDYCTLLDDDLCVRWVPTDRWLEGDADEPDWQAHINEYARANLVRGQPTSPPGASLNDMTVPELRWLALHVAELVGIHYDQWDSNYYTEVEFPSHDVTTVTTRVHLEWWNATLDEGRALRLACDNVEKWFSQFDDEGAKQISCRATDSERGTRFPGTQGASFAWEDDWGAAVNDAIEEWERFILGETARLTCLKNLRDQVFADGKRWREERDKLLERCRQQVAKDNEE